jgi:hypothetical protein
MERRDLYQDDLTEERQITPAQRDNVARTEVLDPDVLDTGRKADLDGAADDDARAEKYDEEDDEDLDGPAI